MTPDAPNPSTASSPHPRRNIFIDDFRKFFLRGLAALMPTLITLWLLVKIWSFLWETLGQHIIWGIKRVWIGLAESGAVDYRSKPVVDVNNWFRLQGEFRIQIIGVLLAVLLVYIIGMFVGNIIGRTGWRLLERAVLRIPFVRAIYPAVKQVTDFLLAERSAQFEGSRVVAVQPHDNGIWSIGLVTGNGLRPVSDSVGRDMLTVFIPSSPTAFSGYVLVVPKDDVIELPMSVEEAMRLLITGGVATPVKQSNVVAALPPIASPAAPISPAESTLKSESRTPAA